jgi:hypothetical protein
MTYLKYTLIADGSSDSVLLNIIQWCINIKFPKVPSEGKYADFRTLKSPPKNLQEKIKFARLYYPYDVLFIHRDAESINWARLDERKNEIISAISDNTQLAKTVVLIPMKMTETWLLINSEAIKKAAGNRNYSGEINLPPVNTLESIQQPKKLLCELLRNVSGLKGRNLIKFNERQAIHIVAENIDDFSPLRSLGAFKNFEQELTDVISKILTANS